MFCLWLSGMCSALSFLLGNLKEAQKTWFILESFTEPQRYVKKKGFKSLPLRLSPVTKLTTVNSSELLANFTHLSHLTSVAMWWLNHNRKIPNHSWHSITDFIRKIDYRKVSEKSNGLDTTRWQRPHLTPLKKEHKEIWGWFLKRIHEWKWHINYSIKIFLLWTYEEL